MASTQYAQCQNFTTDTAEPLPPFCNGQATIVNGTDFMPPELLQRFVSIIVPILFGFIVTIGLIGNSLVVIVVAANKQMRSTTNLLIINLAVADLLFIIFCVPFTATDYVLTYWPFGEVWCKIVQYLIVVTAYASVYTLVLMSVDRFLAVVHPITSMSIRTERNAILAIGISWMLFILCSVPVYITHGEVHYTYDTEQHTACVFLEPGHSQKEDVNISGFNKPAFQIIFFLTSYVIPLALICGLYLCILLRLWRGAAPGGRVSAESRRGKRRVTRMVVVVVAIFAFCWFPIQVILVLKSIHQYDTTTFHVMLQIVSHVLAYMNSCVNPILYTFLSENFRKAFRKIVACGPPGVPPMQGDKSTVTTKTTNRHDIL